jgi:hypothetical protein
MSAYKEHEAATAMQQLGEALTKEPATMLRLYELPDALEAVEAQLLEFGGELTPELEAQLEAIEGTLEIKAERICRMIANNDRAAEAYQAEIERMDAHRSAHANTASRLKKYLQSVLERLNRPKLQAGVFPVRLQLNGQPSIRLANPFEIPERFRRVPAVEFNSSAALAELREQKLIPSKAGEFPIGEFIVTRGQHLRYK